MAISISNRLSKRFQHSSVLVALLLLTMLVVPTPVWAAVSVDTDGFNPEVTGGFLVPSEIYSIALQPDGKVLFGGQFTAVEGVAHYGIARLHADGSLDANFNPNLTGEPRVPYITEIALQPDGKILVSGNYTEVDGVTRNGFARLNATGNLDTSFNPDINNSVRIITLQPDGKILIGGSFTEVDKIARNGLARLNTDGSLDTSFNPAANGSVLVLQPDGKVLIGTARLNNDGSLDTSFDTNINGSISSLALQPDGKILISGSFIEVDGVARNGIARLNSDGSLDPGFDPNMNGDSASTLAIQFDGKILYSDNLISTILLRPQFQHQA